MVSESRQLTFLRCFSIMAFFFQFQKEGFLKFFSNLMGLFVLWPLACARTSCLLLFLFSFVFWTQRRYSRPWNFSSKKYILSFMYLLNFCVFFIFKNFQTFLLFLKYKIKLKLLIKICYFKFCIKK